MVRYNTRNSTNSSLLFKTYKYTFMSINVSYQFKTDNYSYKLELCH